MQKLECGICRTKFKKEYFENDPIANELFNFNNHIHRRNHRSIRGTRSINRLYRININEQDINRNNNNIITDNIRIIINPGINYYIRNRNNNLRNSHNIQNNINNESLLFFGIFILSFKPSKTFCISSLLLNIFFCGLGTILIGINKKSIFYTLFGIIQCFSFFIFLVYGVLFNNNKKIFGRTPITFFTYYFKILSLLFYISSIYIAIFRNFLFFNLRKINVNAKKERGLIVFFLNILIGGSGSLLVGITNLSQEGHIWDRIKYLIYGIIQLFGYILTLFGISSIENKSIIKVDSGLIFIFCTLCFIFGLYTSYLYYKKINSSLN